MVFVATASILVGRLSIYLAALGDVRPFRTANFAWPAGNHDGVSGVLRVLWQLVFAVPCLPPFSTSIMADQPAAILASKLDGAESSPARSNT